MLTIFLLTVAFSGSAFAKNDDSTDRPWEHEKCTGIYIGKDLTPEGSGVLLGQTGDENSSHWVQVVPHKTHDQGAAIEVGAGPKADLPGKRTEIPQVRETNKYITTTYSEYAGFKKPLENGGINEHQVSGIDVWSPSREELVEMTPEGQTGLTYSDFARVAMERAATAKEAVKIIGSLVDKYGNSTYGGNTHMIADPNEGWIIEEFAGSQGLWVAQRLDSDDIKVIRPGHIGNIPENYKEHSDYMGSDNLISFAVEQGWYDPDSGKPFNVSEVYEADRNKEKPGHQMKSAPVVKAEKILQNILEENGELTVKDFMQLLRTRPYTYGWGGTKYGQVAQLREDVPDEMGVLWIAISQPEASAFIPFYLGVDDIPTEYKEHSYLTKGEAKRYSMPDKRRGQESTKYAYRTYNRLWLMVDEHYDKFHPEVAEAFGAYQDNLLDKQAAVEETVLKLYQTGNEELASEYLTDYTNEQALKGLRIAEDLTGSIETRSKLVYGINEFQ
ncbi:MAG: C69 family dipeptidase [Clostridiales bacterium]|nr:C69 family dipeptidase [Clostridiales bacterium]MCF8022999.1 C69 family dipeptidase [Clostridiales bacterium]